MKQAIPTAINQYQFEPNQVSYPQVHSSDVLSANTTPKVAENSSFIQKTKQFFELLANLGIDTKMPFREAKLVRFTNIICVLTVLGIVLYIPYSIATGSYLLAFIEAIDAAMVASALYFTHKKHYSTAKLVLIGVVNMFIYINACYIGHDAQVQHFYVLINIVPFLVFRLSHIKHIIASVAMTIGWFILYQLTYPYFTEFNLPKEVQDGTRQIGTWLDFVLFGSAIFLLAKNNYEIEEELAQNNNLLQSQTTELKRSNEDLEQFAYIISHDLRVPLKNISNFLTLLEKKHADDLKGDAKAFIHYSVSGAKRLERLIEDLLSYSKVGRNLPPTQSVDTNELLQTIEFEMRDKLLHTNHKITVQGQLPVLQDVHSTMVYHIFQNLITNGLKFNKNENPEVVVSASSKKDSYIFEIKDNGIGIPAEHKNKLFQMFKRLHTENEFQGTGMGLAICKRIVNFYNGEVWFESEIGKGTSFFFSFPKKLPAISID